MLELCPKKGISATVVVLLIEDAIWKSMANMIIKLPLHYYKVCRQETRRASLDVREMTVKKQGRLTTTTSRYEVRSEETMDGEKDGSTHSSCSSAEGIPFSPPR